MSCFLDDTLRKHAERSQTKLCLWSGPDIICWGVCALQHHKVFSTGHCWVNICSCCRIFIPFRVKLEDTLFCIFCIIGSMFGTSDIHPVDRPCLTLHAIWFLEMCNHGLEDCFLLSRGENDELVRGARGLGWWWVVYQMSVSSGLLSSHVQFHCIRCLIEVL